MKETEKNNIKDNILELLKDCKSRDVGAISKEISKDPKLISYLVEELGKEGLVKLVEITSLDTKSPKDYLVHILNKGVFLIDIDGGFKRINCQLRIEEAWRITKIVAAVLNAVAIISIGICSLLV